MGVPRAHRKGEVTCTSLIIHKIEHDGYLDHNYT